MGISVGGNTGIVVLINWHGNGITRWENLGIRLLLLKTKP
jgi:hypothetical protein